MELRKFIQAVEVWWDNRNSRRPTTTEHMMAGETSGEEWGGQGVMQAREWRGMREGGGGDGWMGMAEDQTTCKHAGGTDGNLDMLQLVSFGRQRVRRCLVPELLHVRACPQDVWRRAQPKR